VQKIQKFPSPDFIGAPFPAIRSYSSATRPSCPVGYPLLSGAQVYLGIYGCLSFAACAFCLIKKR